MPSMKTVGLCGSQGFAEGLAFFGAGVAVIIGDRDGVVIVDPVTFYDAMRLISISKIVATSSMLNPFWRSFGAISNLPSSLALR
jgi:hypothetical protein